MLLVKYVKSIKLWVLLIEKYRVSYVLYIVIGLKGINYYVLFVINCK